MSSDEELLDDLLKSIMENEDESSHLKSNTEGNLDSVIEDLGDAVSDDLDFAIEELGESEELQEEMSEEMAEGTPDTFSADEFAIQDFGVEEPDLQDIQSDTEEIEEEAFSLTDFAIQEPDIDDINIEDVHLEESEEAFEEDLLETAWEGMEDEESSDIMSPDEVDAMFLAADTVASEEELLTSSDAEDDELAEINGLLHTDASAIADDDMLALLESMSADLEENDKEIFPSDSKVSKQSDVQETEEPFDSTDKKKGFFAKLFSKEKKNKEDDKADETEIISQVEEESEYSEPISQEEGIENPPSKKKNFFATIFAFLTESDEEEESEDGDAKSQMGMEPSTENRDILQELAAEDKKKKKKKVKGKKAEDLDEEDDGEEESKPSKDKKRKKTQKVPKAETKDILVVHKPGKKISKKNVAVIMGLSLTLTAIVVVLCSIVPGFFDKQKARDAYYASDYGKSYELLYGKKLDSSDTIIFNKSKIIMELNRKLTSYHNYMSMGKEVQALDALMSGIQKYPDIYVKAEEYHVTQEVNTIYETILNILNDKYSLSESVAKVIVAYEDDVTYTRKLESIVYNIPFVMPGEEDSEEEESTVSDILPEEQQIAEVSSAMEQEPSEETNQVVLEEELPLNTEAASQSEEVQAEEMQSETLQEEESQPEESQPMEEVTQIPLETDDDTTNGQGQLIQGLRQPINIEIKGN